MKVIIEWKFPWILSNCHDSCKIVLALCSFFFPLHFKKVGIWQGMQVYLWLIPSRTEMALAMVSSAPQLMCCPQPRLLRRWGISTKNGIFRGPEMPVFLSATFVGAPHWGDGRLGWFLLLDSTKKMKKWTYNSNNSKRSNILMLSMSTYSGIEFWTS